MPRVNPFVERLHICPELYQTCSDLEDTKIIMLQKKNKNKDMPRVNPFVVRSHICPELHQT